MAYTALYRKFRPGRFEEVKGQDHIVTTLSNQIKSDRIGHAYLFCGTRGTGKTSVAKLFAKAINCQNPDGVNPCCECASCKSIQSGTSLDVVEIDAASNNGVDNIRQIVEEVQYLPMQGRYKVYIVDEVHMLSAGAFNALLKTLEEPPAHIVFILATTEVHKLPVTIRSRCQRYDFRRIGIDSISGRMKELLDIEGVQAEDAAIKYIAKAADGSMRDALSLLDQCIAFNYGEKLTYQMTLEVLGTIDSSTFSNLTRAIMTGDVSGSIEILEQAVNEGKNLAQFVVDMTWYLRNLLLACTSSDMSVIADMSEEAIVKLKDEARLVEPVTVIRYIRVLSELTNQIRFATEKRVLIEVVLIKLCKPEMETGNDALLERVKRIEETLEKGVSFETKSDVSSDKASEEKPIESASLPAAVPDDIKVIAAKWDRIIASADSSDKSFLKLAKPSVGPNGELLLVFLNGLGYTHFVDKEHPDGTAHDSFLRFQDLIESFVGKKIEIKLEQAKDAVSFKRDFGDIRDIKDKIDMPIEEEE